jgi:hypothetical protein
MEDLIYICVNEEQLFQGALRAAVEMIYRFQDFAQIIDSQGVLVSFDYIDGKGYCGEVPKPDTAS